MDYRIETKDAFQVFGVEDVFKVESGIFSTGNEAKLRKPSDLWDDCFANDMVEKLEAQPPATFLSLFPKTWAKSTRYATTEKQKQARSHICCAHSVTRTASVKVMQLPIYPRTHGQYSHL